MDSVTFSERAVSRDLIGKQRHACEVANRANWTSNSLCCFHLLVSMMAPLARYSSSIHWLYLHVALGFCLNN
jgi:hypothetical protein